MATPIRFGLATIWQSTSLETSIKCTKVSHKISEALKVRLKCFLFKEFSVRAVFWTIAFLLGRRGDQVMWIQTKIIARPVFIGFRYDAGGTLERTEAMFPIPSKLSVTPSSSKYHLVTT